MMNKKNICLAIIMIFCAGLWWRSQSIGFSSTASILIRDQAKLESHFKPEILSNKQWPQVNDYSLSAQNLVNQKNSRELFILNHSSAKDLAACLKKNFCGMEKRSDDDAYFDEAKTPGHILLGRNLDIMLEALRINPDLQTEIDWDLIRELTESENEKIQVIALTIIKDYDASNEDIAKLLKIADHFKGEAKASALEQIASRDSSIERMQLMNAVEKSFALDDPHTVISIVEKMEKMSLSKEEIAKVSRNLCRFKESGADDPNWKMIKYDMRPLADLDQLCH